MKCNTCDVKNKVSLWLTLWKYNIWNVHLLRCFHRRNIYFYVAVDICISSASILIETLIWNTLGTPFVVCYNPFRSTNWRIVLQRTKYIGQNFCECMYSQMNSKGISPPSICAKNCHIRTRILNNLTSTILPNSWFPDNERRMNNPIKIIYTDKPGSDYHLAEYPFKIISIDKRESES